MKKNGVYDFIFAGAGAATLQILGQLLDDDNFATASILILERNSKKENDRTWCFWEPKDNSSWNNAVVNSWDHITFASPEKILHESISPFAYKMIRSSKYYNSMAARIGQFPNVDMFFEEVNSFDENPDHVVVSTDNHNYKGTYFLNSILDWSVLKRQNNYPILQQHFVGWYIKTGEACFDSKTATFMDFGVEQRGNTRFMYILPLSKNEALIEYTLFSKNQLKKAEYEREIRAYLTKKNIRNYIIEETEQGSIPMTCYPFQNTIPTGCYILGQQVVGLKPAQDLLLNLLKEKPKNLFRFYVKIKTCVFLKNETDSGGTTYYF